MSTRLKELRSAAGYRSARAFAEAHGVNANTYAGYEQGKPVPLALLWTWADEFGVTLDQIVGRDFEGPALPADSEIAEAYGSLDDEAKAVAAAAVRGIADYAGNR